MNNHYHLFFCSILIWFSWASCFKEILSVLAVDQCKKERNGKPQGEGGGMVAIWAGKFFLIVFAVFAFICHFSIFMKDENFIVSEEKKQELYNTTYLIEFTYI